MSQPLYDKYKHELDERDDRFDDPVEYIKEMLEDDGIVMDGMTISLILKYFSDFKYNALVAGNGIREPGLYSLEYVFRYRHNHGGTPDHGIQPSIVLRAYLDRDLRKAMGSRFINDKEMRDRITGGRELTERELDYIKRHYAKEK